MGEEVAEVDSFSLFDEGAEFVEAGGRVTVISQRFDSDGQEPFVRLVEDQSACQTVCQRYSCVGVCSGQIVRQIKVAGGAVAGPVGEIVGGTVGAAVGAGLEIPNAVITSVQGERVPSVTVRERVVVGEPLPEVVELRPVPRHTEYRYAIVNDRRVIVEPRTRKIIKIID